MGDIVMNLRKLSIMVNKLGYVLVFNKTRKGYLDKNELTSRLCNRSSKHSYIHKVEHRVYDAIFIKQSIINDLNINLEINQDTKLFNNPFSDEFINTINMNNHNTIFKYQFIAVYYNRCLSNQRSFCSSLLYGFDMSLSQIAACKSSTKSIILMTELYKTSLLYKCNFVRTSLTLDFARWFKYTIRYKYPIMIPNFHITRTINLLKLKDNEYGLTPFYQKLFSDASINATLQSHNAHNIYSKNCFKYNQWFAKVKTFKSKLKNLTNLYLLYF